MVTAAANHIPALIAQLKRRRLIIQSAAQPSFQNLILSRKKREAEDDRARGALVPLGEAQKK
jgi:hypothetical protein